MALKCLIESLGVYIPEGRLSTAEVLTGCRNPPQVDLESLTGIQTRPVAAENEYSINLAIKAASKCFEISQFRPEDMEMIINTNISRYSGPDYRFPCEPSTASRLGAHFNAKNAILFDISNACAGMLTGIQIMDAYIQAGIIRRGMVVSGEYISHLTLNAQKEIEVGIDPQLASLTVGDSGAAIILEATENQRVGFHAMDLYTMAKYCDLCVGTTSSKDHGGYVMYTDSSKLLIKLAVQSSEHLEKTFANPTFSGLSYDWIIMHQVASRFIEGVAGEINRRLGKTMCTPENTICNVKERGNSSSTSHFVALWDHIQNGRISSHQNLLFCGQASGIVSAIASYTLDNLPDRIRQSVTTDSLAEKKRA